MKTKYLLLLVLIASAMVKVFVFFCICVFGSVLILSMIQDQALVASKHFLVETEDKTPSRNHRFGGRFDYNIDADNADAKLQNQTDGNDYQSCCPQCFWDPECWTLWW